MLLAGGLGRRNIHYGLFFLLFLLPAAYLIHFTPSTSPSSRYPSFIDSTSWRAMSAYHRQLTLPGFCDYCGPLDKLCTKYGPSILARSRAYEGSLRRLKRVLRKARTPGSTIKIGVLGGSNTQGKAIDPQDNWTLLYSKWWRENFPDSDLIFTNGAVPASSSDYYQTCFLEHIDEDVDLVIIELGINDQRNEMYAGSYETLIRAILGLPNRPALINLQVLALRYDKISTGEDLHLAPAIFYDTPIVNLRNVLLPHILRNNNSAVELEKHWFSDWVGYVDTNHISGQGHQLLGELLISMTQRAMCQEMTEDMRMQSAKSTLTTEGNVSDPTLPSDDDLDDVPRLALLNRYDHTTMLPNTNVFCMSMSSTKHPLVSERSSGWERWFYPSRPDKVYLRATEAGSTISFKARAGALGKIRVTYLRSKSFGLGSLFCWINEHRSHGTRLDGWWEIEHVNLANNHAVASGLKPGEYTLNCEVMEETHDPSGGHEFRIIGVDGG